MIILKLLFVLLTSFQVRNFFHFQYSSRKGGLVGIPLPNDQGVVSEEVFATNRPRDAEAAGIGDRPEAAEVVEDGVHPEVHGLRNALHHDEEETQLSSLRNCKFHFLGC